jgi:hypothetical protein
MAVAFVYGQNRGSGTVKRQPAEADFELIVKDNYAYVLVDDVVVGEYTLSKANLCAANWR